MRRDDVTIEVDALPSRGLHDLEAEWSRLAAESDEGHYAATHAWLTAWAAAYRPRGLLALRARAAGDGLIGLGLIETLALGRWRFAGGGVSPRAAWLCRSGADASVWRAWARWLSSHPQAWTVLEGAGVPAAAAVLERSRLTPVPEYAVELPGSFDAYLAARGSSTRRGLRQKLRRLDAAGGVVVEVAPEGVDAALERFLVLHHSRARQKAERHPDIGPRLVRLLSALRRDGPVVRHVYELRVGDHVAGVTIRLDHRGTGYFYNSGMDPASSRLSPGICLELRSIEDAIAHGLHTFDLGPGEFRYKVDLGGVRREVYRLVATTPALRGRATAGAAVMRRMARDAARDRVRQR